MTKPLLYNGYMFTPEISVQDRITRVFNTEIYNLSNGKKLYLFVDIDLESVINTEVNFIKLNIGNKIYVGIIYDEYDLEFLSKVKGNLLEKKGFACVAGMGDIKQILKEEVILPLQQREKFKKYKLKLPSGILFYGPPGCGKTYIAQKLAEELGWGFMEIKHSDIASTYIHGSVEKIRQIFDMARLKSPTLLFFDEISGLVPQRERLSSDSLFKEEEINEFLINLDNANGNNVLVVGATNFPNRIDKAILRTGRFDLKIFIGPPDFMTRKQVFKYYLEGRPIEEIDFDKLAQATENFTISDINYIVEKAAKKAVVVNSKINTELVLGIVKQTSSSITEDDINFYNSLFDESVERKNKIGFRLS